MIGACFWARTQVAAWRELPGAECVAVCDRTRARAEALGVPAVYDDPEEPLRREKPDFLDLLTGVKSHSGLVRGAADAGIQGVCQNVRFPRD